MHYEPSFYSKLNVASTQELAHKSNERHIDDNEKPETHKVSYRKLSKSLLSSCFLIFFILSVMTFAACDGISGGSSPTQGNTPSQSVTNYWPCGNLPSYAAEFGGALLRWKSFPLTVFIDLSNAPRVTEGNNRIRYTNLIQAAALGWKVAGDGRIGDVSFIDSNSADITITFGITSTPGEIAITTYKRDGPYSTSYIDKGTTITLKTSAFENFISNNGFNTVLGSPNFEYTISQTVTHEMGHALFAGSHSNQAQDIMSSGFRPQSSAPTTLSQRDVNSIREAYCKPLGS